MNGKVLRYGIIMIIPLCVLVIFTGSFSVDLFPKQRLKTARDQWNAQHPASYQMQVRTVMVLGRGFGPFPLGDYQIMVKDGKVVEAGERNWVGAISDPTIPYRPVDSLDKVSALTMDQIFDYAQSQLAPLSDINLYSCGQNRIEADYHRAQGYVNALQATCAGGWFGCSMSDCGALLVVENLKPLNP
jgi:hypothetical protein